MFKYVVVSCYLDARSLCRVSEQLSHLFWMLILIFWDGHMQALPIFLDDMFNEFVAVLLSVTLVLAFGEVWLNFLLSFWIFSF